MNRWLESDWVLRISSIVISIVLWLIVTHSFPFQREDHTTLRIDGVPVEIRYDKDEYALQEVNQQQVQLTLSGNKKDLRSIPSYQVFVDLTEMKSGQRQQVPIQVTGLPRNIQVKVFPAHLTVLLDKKVQKEVPVRIRLEGKLPDGYEIVQLKVSPNHVLLRGTESQLKQINEVEAVANINQAQFPFEKWVKLQAPNHQVTLSPGSAKVLITVREPSKTLPLDVEVSKQPPEGYRVEQIEFEPKSVRLSGPQKVLQSITHYPPIQLDLSDQRSDQTLSMTIPRVNREVKVEPKELEIRVQITKE